MSDQLKFEILVYGAALLAAVAALSAKFELAALLAAMTGVG